jgi:F-type H+-transporting ATPase subunit b
VFVVPNLTLLFQDLAFLVLMVLLARYLYRPIQNALQTRTERIRAGLKAAEEAKREREAAQRDYEARLQDARQEGQKLLAQVTQAAERLRAELEGKAKEQAEQIIKRARAEIQNERERAVQELRAQVADLAVQVAARVIGENLDARKHQQLIEKTIEEAELRA